MLPDRVMLVTTKTKAKNKLDEIFEEQNGLTNSKENGKDTPNPTNSKENGNPHNSRGNLSDLDEELKTEEAKSPKSWSPTNSKGKESTEEEPTNTKQKDEEGDGADTIVAAAADLFSNTTVQVVSGLALLALIFYLYTRHKNSTTKTEKEEQAKTEKPANPGNKETLESIFGREGMGIKRFHELS